MTTLCDTLCALKAAVCNNATTLADDNTWVQALTYPITAQQLATIKTKSAEHAATADELCRKATEAVENAGCICPT